MFNLVYNEKISVLFSLKVDNVLVLRCDKRRSPFHTLLFCVAICLALVVSGCSSGDLAEERIEIGAMEISYPSDCDVHPENPEKHAAERADGSTYEVENVHIADKDHTFSIEASVLYGVPFEEISEHANDLAEEQDDASQSQNAFDYDKWGMDPQSLPSNIIYEKPENAKCAGLPAISQRWSWSLDGREFRGVAHYVQLDEGSVSAFILLCDLEAIDEGTETLERISGSIRK